MSAGDVLLFSRPSTWANFRADPFGTFMCALIHLTTRSRYNHAALAIGPDENGVELMVEATGKGVAVNRIHWSAEITDAIPLYEGNDLEEVLAWSTARVGWKYGYATAFMCGLRSMFPGFSVVQDKAIICSQLVAEGLERAGHDFGKSTEKVSPGDLAEHFGVPR